MKKVLIFFICLLYCFICSAQLNTTKVVENRILVCKIGNHSIVKDPKLGYILAVKGNTTLYLIELGKNVNSAKETIEDLITIGKDCLFAEATMWNQTMFIYGDSLTNNKPIVRFKDPKLTGSAYISIEQLEQLHEF